MFDEEKKQQFIKKGKMAEEAFSRFFDNISPSDPAENRREHWDFKIETKVDVKGLKRISREAGETNEHVHFLEICGITGLPGWLYGSAHYFSFELNDYWVVVEKKALQEFVKENVKKEYTAQPELYKLYQRRDRKDVLTLVTSYDLCYISSTIIKKKK